ncbi:MurR/RpiR family transcriptional regulator [Bradyrhizobium sp. 23AC]
MNIPIPSRGTVAERIRVVRNHLSPSELVVANGIIKNYPTGGLVPIAQLASDAKVSGPTVLRLVAKLGFDGYAEFHAALRDEIQKRIFSPVDLYPARTRGGKLESPTSKAQAAYYECIRSTFSRLDENELQSAVSALSNPDRPVYIMGGRVSSVLATHLGTFLSLLRKDVTVVSWEGFSRSAGIIDMGPKSTAVLLDFRHYQETVVGWGVEAAKRKAHIVVFTDQYLSPLAQHATSLLTCSTEGLNPFDSMVGAFALAELVISEVARSLGAPARKRLSDLTAYQLNESENLPKLTPFQRGAQE